MQKPGPVLPQSVGLCPGVSLSPGDEEKRLREFLLVKPAHAETGGMEGDLDQLARHRQTIGMPVEIVSAAIDFGENRLRIICDASLRIPEIAGAEDRPTQHKGRDVISAFETVVVAAES